MKILFVGTRGDVDSKSAKHDRRSGLILESEGFRLLVECGEKSHLEMKPDAVLISHAHSSQIQGLKGGTEIPVYTPEHVTDSLKKWGIETLAIKEGETRDVGTMKVTPFRVEHSNESPCYLFRIRAGDKTVICATNVLLIPDQQEVLRGADLYIGDGSSLEREIKIVRENRVYGHASIKEQVKMAEIAEIPRAIFTHLGSVPIGMHERSLRKRVQEFSEKVDSVIAFDGLEFIELQTQDEIANTRSSELYEAVLPYEPNKMRDDQLADDWRIFGGWYSTVASGKEFKYSANEILEKFAIPALREIIRRGKQEFHPENWKDHPKVLYLRAFDSVIRKYLLDPDAQRFVIGEKKAFVAEKERLALESFLALRSKDKELGFVRFKSPKEESGGFLYEVRDFIPWDDPITVKIPQDDQMFGDRTRVKAGLAEEIFDASLYEPERLKSLSNDDLLQTHETLHSIFLERGSRKGDDPVIKANLLVIKEFVRREVGLPAFPDYLDQHTLELARITEGLKDGCLDEWMKDKARAMSQASPIIIIPDYLSWSGSAAYGKERVPNDVDWIVRDDKISEALWLKLHRLAMKFLGVKPCVHTSPVGPNWRYLGMFDLALIPKKEFKFADVDSEGFRKFFYESQESLEEMDYLTPIEWHGRMIESGLGSDALIPLIGTLYDDPMPEPGISTLKERRMDAEKMPKNSAVIQNHWRGKSSHFDLRIKMNGHLEGWTLTAQPEGKIEKEVDSIAKAREMQDRIKWKFDPDMSPQTRVLALKKSRHPLAWLGVQNEVVPPGEIGATKKESGVFYTVARGIAHPGVSKPHFVEYFLDMSPFKGRTVFRLLPVKKEWEKAGKARVVWQAWTNLENQTPYLLTRRGRTQKDFTPPAGESRISPEWEKKIKPELRWWTEGVSPKDRLRRMDLAYNDLIERDIIKGRPIKVSGE